MKRSIFALLALSSSSLLLSQTPTLSTSARTATHTGLQLRGPETVAQQDPKRVVATVEGKPVTAEQALSLLKQIPENQRSASGNLDQLLEQMYMLDHFSGEAVKANLQNQSPWKEDLDFTRERILAQAYLQHMTAGDSPAAQAAKQYYDAHSNEFEQAKLSGILVGFAPPGTPTQPGKAVRTEEEARAKADDLEKKLKTGADFATLARTDSDNPQSAAKGGDLGEISLNDPKLPASIRTAIAGLQSGQISEPVQIPSGFYIFKTVSRTKLPFSEVRSQLIMRQIYDQYKIQVKDPAFFNASNTPSLANPSGNAPQPNPQSAPAPGTPAKPSASPAH
jgi:peptidyl-prolyl cis-trans isomerase C